MNILPILRTGKLIVVSSTHETREQITTLTAELALRGAVTILDGGNRFAAYQTIRKLRMRTPDVEKAASHIFVRRAFTCYQMVSLLESSPSLQQPYIIMDMLATFYDENVQPREADRLLDQCLAQLDRLRLTGPIVVSLKSHTDRNFLAERVLSKADNVIEVEIPYPVLAQAALF